MITVFIGTYNRLSTLARTVRSYQKFKTPHQLVIVDNGTDNLYCQALLGRLEYEGLVKKIYRLPICNSMEEATDNFNIAIRDQYERADAEWFAVSEADVCFEGTNPKALDKYVHLAMKTERSVGAHLRVDDKIPASYPLRSRVMACESRLLYKSDMLWYDGIPYTPCQTDTTFHLFPRRDFFNRLHMDPLRVGPPYDAMHLDWYLDIFKPNRENEIYIPGTRQIGSWGKAWLRDFWFWFQEDPVMALERLHAEPAHPDDLCNNSFMLSWCYQYGHGCEPNREESEKWLRYAIPDDNRYYWPFEENWLKMIYDNDFSSLGWK